MSVTISSELLNWSVEESQQATNLNRNRRVICIDKHSLQSQGGGGRYIDGKRDSESEITK